MPNSLLAVVEEDISRLLVDASKLELPSSRKQEFRCSSLPFCPIRTFLGLSKGEDSYRMDHYTISGTALHELMQKWLPRTLQGSRRSFGAWKCEDCTLHIEPCLKPRECPKCKGRRLKYEEVLISFKGLSGHVDYLYEWSKGQFVIIDFKSTSLMYTRNKYPNSWREQYPPSRKYIVQIKSYACLLREQYGLNITAVMLVFIDRSRPIESEKDFHIVTSDWNEVKHDKLMKKLNRAIEHNNLLLRLQRRVEASEEFSEQALNTLTKMVNDRPCKSENSWKAWMRYGFWGNRECEMLKSCCSSDKQAMKAVLKKIEDSQ